MEGEYLELVPRLAIALGAAPISDVWMHQLDEDWWIAINGGGQAAEAAPPDAMSATIEPYHMAVWYNGWLAGLLSPTGGVLAAGRGANEATFTAALKAALERAEGATAPAAQARDVA